jgi:hypothetical protein
MFNCLHCIPQYGEGRFSPIPEYMLHVMVGLAKDYLSATVQ